MPLAPCDNEQMEFLGDSILGFLISETLIERFPHFPEGKLSKLKAHLVSASHLLDAAQTLEIGKYLRLGRGEELSGGRSKRTLLVDALEALIAAVYLDGGIDPARQFVSRFIIAEEPSSTMSLEERVSAASVDFKTALQELARKKRLALPRYSIVKERGPEHSKTFTVEVRVGRDWVCQAEGVTKKSASQKAARIIFERMSEEG
jgi:ribonuclease-3